VICLQQLEVSFIICIELKLQRRKLELVFFFFLAKEKRKEKKKGGGSLRAYILYLLSQSSMPVILY
jgi:hypothetical protein